MRFLINQKFDKERKSLLNEINKNRRCTDCSDHSGVMARVSAAEKLMAKFEVYMEKQTIRTYTIMIGVIMCLLTGFTSVYVSNVNNFRKIEKKSKTDTELFLKAMQKIIKEVKKK